MGIGQELTSLIPTRRLNALARRSGLVQRRRKVDAMALFSTASTATAATSSRG